MRLQMLLLPTLLTATSWLACNNDCDPSKDTCSNRIDAAAGASGSVDAAVVDAAALDAAVDESPDLAPPSCPPLNGTVLNHANDILVSETWAGDGTLHKWLFGAAVRPGATLTLAPCAVVQVNQNISLTLRGAANMPAKLISLGTMYQPVLITNVPGSPNWGSLTNYDPDGTFDLSYTTLENGGSGVFHGATIDVRATIANPGASMAPVIRVDHVTVKNSAGTGVVLESGAAFTADSTELTVTGGGNVGGGGDSAIEITQLAAGTLPTLHVSGNAIDQIRVSAAPASLFISRDLTLKNLGPPYYFAFNRTRVTDPSGMFMPTLTIAAGVEMRFDDYLMVGNMNVTDWPGKLIAVGTAAQPIVFTSSKPPAMRAAGDWAGVWLHSAAGSRLENVRIEFAGGANGIGSSNCKPVGSPDNGALFVGGLGATYIPAATDFVAVTVVNSAAHGINAMWTAAAFGPDLTAGFTFQTIGPTGCKQTKNALPTGCANMPGCLVP